MEDVIELVRSNIGSFKAFSAYVETFFREDAELSSSVPVVHSTKSRIKNLDHLRGKIERKNAQCAASGEDPITAANVFERITDISGVRVLHLHQAQAAMIHKRIIEQADSGDWYLVEAPKAYTWDPQASEFFKALGLEPLVKESFYTSLHYVVRPRVDAKVACEIQVRTLFEEIWGEVDHSLNYPSPATDLATKELLKVLARLIGSGSQLTDSIYRINAGAASERAA